MYRGDLTTFKPKVPLVTLAVEQDQQPSTSAQQQMDDIFGQSDASLGEWESAERDIADDESCTLSPLHPPRISDEEGSLSGRESFRTGERSYTASEAEDQEIVSSAEYQQILIEEQQGLGEQSSARDYVSIPMEVEENSESPAEVEARRQQEEEEESRCQAALEAQ